MAGAPARRSHHWVWLPGNDRIDLGAGDWGKSQDGDDFYFLHGLGSSYRAEGPAILWPDIETDVIHLAADRGLDVTDYDVTRLNVEGGVKTVRLNTLTVEGDDSSPLLDDQSFRARFIPIPGEDRPVPEITYRGGERALENAVQKFVNAGEGDWWIG